MILVVTYDLHNPIGDYPKVEAALTSGDGGWAHPQGSVWLLDTAESPDAWRDRLQAAVDADGEFFVAQLHNNWGWLHADAQVSAWLRDPRRRW